MKKFGLMMAMTAGILISAGTSLAQKDDQQGQGHAVITVLPAHAGEELANVNAQDVRLKVNGKESTVTNWTPQRGPNSRLELILLIDGSARTSLGQQFSDIQSFVKEMPANAKFTIGYMDNGRAALAGPLSSDAGQVLRGLHLSAGSPGSNASPYFCLSDLAKNWPSKDPTARREVVMITDGVDNYDRRFDPDDPYVQSAISDSIRAGLVVYSIYWQDQGRLDSSAYASNAGQSLLLEVTQATGGNGYWEGLGNPVSMQPFFNDLRRRLRNQYTVSFTSPLKGKPEVASMKLELHVPSAKVEAPQRVFVSRATNVTGE